jgi:putative nucleotidyltransferase with HDIG domain
MDQRISDLIIMLSAGITQRRLYFDDHPRVRELGSSLAEALATYLESRQETGFFFGVLNGKFIYQGKYLVGPSIAGRPLLDLAGNLGCGGFLFRKGLQPEEAAAFFTLAAETRDKLTSLSEASQCVQSRGIVHIELSPHYREGIQRQGDAEAASSLDPGLIQFDLQHLDDYEVGDDDAVREDLSRELSPLLPIFQSLYQTVTENNAHISSDSPLDLDQAGAVSDELLGVSDQQTLDVMNLMRYPDYDSYTVGHSVRVATLALSVGRRLGWPDHLLPVLSTAGLMHDIGKAKVPDEILYKPDRLTPEELKVAEMHAAVGARILLAQGDAHPVVIAATWGHHIRQDRGGYPQVPDWVRLSPAASLIQACDVFEALTAARPYKTPMSPREAFAIILKDRAAFDPRVLRALVDTVGLYPVGSEVVLSDGLRGFVVARGHRWGRPVVRVVRDRKGHKLSRRDQYTLDLNQEPLLDIKDFYTVELGEPVDQVGSPA